MSRTPRSSVCAAVVSDLSTDARVWKEVRSLAHAGRQVLLIGCRYEIVDVQRQHKQGIDVIEVPLGSRHGRVSMARRAATLLTLWREIVRTSSDVYHAHNIHTWPACWLASRLRRSLLVYDAHELYGEAAADDDRVAHALARVEYLVERMAVRRSDAVITTNHSRARVLSERHGCCEITVLHNVPPVKETVTPDPTGFPNGVVVLLYQGGIYARTRAFQETIQALKLLPDVHFVIVGFGRETDIDQIRVWALEYDVSDRVHLLPPRPFDALVDCAAAATVGLVPIKALRLNHYLGDTNKLHEYLMAGLPVVGSDLPEIRRVITEGDPQVGEVFDPTSPESIASAVSQVLRDGAGYEARRRQARQLALNSHNWEIEETQLLEMYNGLAR